MSEELYTAVGRCGALLPAIIPATVPVICVLPAGHAGWHRSDGGAEWGQLTEAAGRQLRLDPDSPRTYVDAEGRRWVNVDTVTALRQRDEARAALAQQIEETEEVAGELAEERTLLDQLRPLIDRARAWRTTLHGLGDDTSPEEDALAEAVDTLPLSLGSPDSRAQEKKKPASPYDEPGEPCAGCGCPRKYHDGAGGRCAGDFLACPCRGYAAAEQAEG